MKIYLLLVLLIKLVSPVQYNEPCTFSLGTCHWSIGRRWHIVHLDDDDKVLIADAESKDDQRTGFTDAIMSSWLHLSSICSFDIRLTFQYSIPNENDHLEIYLIEKNRTRMKSLGQWKGRGNRNNSAENNETIWQQGNVTFKAAEEFRIDIEIRHLPEKMKNNSIVWFAIDDILIENCPFAIMNTTSSTYYTTEMSTSTSILSTTKFYSNENNSTLLNMSYLKFDPLSSEFPSFFLRQNLLTLILYLLCALIALTLLIILFSIIIFTYRKHCCPSSSSETMIDRRYRMGKNNRIAVQIENIDHGNPNIKTIDTPTVRPCFE